MQRPLRARNSTRPPHPWASIVWLAAVVSTVAPADLVAQSLRGSTASLDRQNRVARQHDYTYIDTPERVRFFASQGWLVRVEPTADFRLDTEVSFPFARPEVALFIRRLGAQYRRACGEQLVVTSLTRPTTRQPRNASDRSVHPTGMAVDLRYPWRGCRTWLERVLKELEASGVLEATLERRPVHYHVALFPSQYASYVDRILDRQAARAQDRLAYKVRRGDSLWTIARTHGTTVDNLQTVNQLDSSRIYVGQVLDVPVDD